MSRSQRSPVIRVLLALVIMVCAELTCLVVLAGAGSMTRWATLIAELSVLAWLATLEVANGPHAPLRAVRLSLGLGTLLDVLLLSGVPFPPMTSDDRQVVLTLLAGVVASVLCAVWVVRRAHLARILAVLLGVYGIAMAIAGARLPQRAFSPTDAPIIISQSFAVMLGASWIAALWHLYRSERATAVSRAPAGGHPGYEGTT